MAETEEAARETERRKRQEETAKEKGQQKQGRGEWVSRMDTPNKAIIEFQEFMKTYEKGWEDECREVKKTEGLPNQRWRRDNR